MKIHRFLLVFFLCCVLLTPPSLFAFAGGGLAGAGAGAGAGSEGVGKPKCPVKYPKYTKKECSTYGDIIKKMPERFEMATKDFDKNKLEPVSDDNQSYIQKHIDDTTKGLHDFQGCMWDVPKNISESCLQSSVLLPLYYAYYAASFQRDFDVAFGTIKNPTLPKESFSERIAKLLSAETAHAAISKSDTIQLLEYTRAIDQAVSRGNLLMNLKVAQTHHVVTGNQETKLRNLKETADERENAYRQAVLTPLYEQQIQRVTELENRTNYLLPKTEEYDPGAKGGSIQA